MNPDALTWATPDHFARRVTFRHIALREDAPLKLYPNESIKKISYDCPYFHLIIMSVLEGGPGAEA